MFTKTYKTGDTITIELSPSGRSTVRKLNGVPSPLLGSIAALPKPAVVAGVTYAHMIGGKYALTAAELAEIREITEEAHRNDMAFERAVSPAHIYAAMAE